MNFTWSDSSSGTLGGALTFLSSIFCVGSIVEGPCCDQIKGSSFVWQTPQGRSSGQKSFLPLFSKISLSFFFFHGRKDVRHCQDEPPARKQLKARPCEGLTAVQPEKQPRGRLKWKMKRFHQLFDNSSLSQVYQNSMCHKGASHMLVNDKIHQAEFKFIPRVQNMHTSYMKGQKKQSFDTVSKCHTAFFETAKIRQKWQATKVLNPFTP